MDHMHLVFGWIDYFLFGALLGLSLIIGIYFGLFSKQNSAAEYLYGGKKMNYIPVAFSILASLLSGITFLGIPTEVYLHGSQYAISAVSNAAASLTTVYIFMPVFYELQLSSNFEYLEMRFSKFTRTFASFLYTLSLLLFIPIVIYVPALAFAQVTGYSLHVITPIFSFVCIIYTSMGGVKAVIWTDTIQFVFTMGGLATVLILGSMSVGGVSEIWRLAEAGGRLKLLDFDPSPLTRSTFWGMTIGIYFSSLARFGTAQKFIQRFLTIEKEVDIKKSIFIMTFGWITIQLACIFLGLIIYAKYHDCDPLSAKFIKRSDQTLPYFVMDIAGYIPGFSGIFLAGLVSSALSTMSAALNTLSGTIYDNFIDCFIEESPRKDARAAALMKAISFTIGIVTIALIFVIEHLGTIFEMAFSISSIVDGPLFSLFLLGMVCPWIGKTSANIGGVVSLVIMTWIVGVSQWHIANNNVHHAHLPVSIEKCSNIDFKENLTIPVMNEIGNADNDPLPIFKISMLHLVVLGTLIATVTAHVVNSFTGENGLKNINPQHISPVFRRFLPKKHYYAIAMSEKNPIYRLDK